MLQFCWLDVSLKRTTLTGEDYEDSYLVLDKKFTFQLASQYGKVLKVVSKPRPYQSSNFVQMASVTEAGICRKYLNRKILKDQNAIVSVKFFCSPELTEKILQTPAEPIKQNEEEVVQ
jgi:hypothetical protein